MDRYTRRDAEAAFGRLCELMGKRRAESFDDKGAWQLDYNPVYGGYVVHELLDHGGVTEPFGPERVSARELVKRVWFLTAALAITRNAS